MLTASIDRTAAVSEDLKGTIRQLSFPFTVGPSGGDMQVFGGEERHNAYVVLLGYRPALTQSTATKALPSSQSAESFSTSASYCIDAASLSARATVVRWVFAFGISGITDASQTRRLR